MVALLLQTFTKVIPDKHVALYKGLDENYDESKLHIKFILKRKKLIWEIEQEQQREIQKLVNWKEFYNPFIKSSASFLIIIREIAM